MTHLAVTRHRRAKTDAGYVAADTTAAVNILVWIDHLASLQVLKGSLRELPIAITTAKYLASLLESLKNRQSLGLGDCGQWHH